VQPRSSERRLSQGVGHPLEWSVIERCRVMILLTLPFYVGYGLRSAYLITHPEIEPYFSRAWLVVMRDGIVGLVAFWIAFLALGSLERRRPGPHTVYALVGTLSWWIGVAAIAYGLGPITSPAWIAIIVGVVCQLLLLPQAMALGGIAFGLCLVVASMVAVGLGAVPYAPMMSAAPIADGRIALTHLIGATAASLAATLVLLGVVQYIMSQRRNAHEHLAQVNANLEHIVEQHRKTEVALREANRRAEREIEKHHETEAALRFAMRELDHRVKNTLATVQSIAEQTVRSTTSRTEFSDAFFGRIQALARIHGALAARRWEGVMLAELVELVVGPYRQYPGSISVDCGDSFVWPELVRVLGMMLHELATNAVKYGALSSRQGRVVISSRSDHGDGSRLLICWAEHDGPPIGPRGRPGFGMRLIKEALAYEIAGSVTTLRFLDHGLRCDIAIPHPRCP
jgi:two-component sensor histidine kinase